MAYFAKLENSVVTQVISVSNEQCGEPTLQFPETDSAGRAFIANTLKLEGTWLQTSFNGNFRGCYAGIGFTYDADKKVFITPQPFPSWTLDTNNDWQPPTVMPNDGKMYEWNEASLAWIKVAI